MTGFMHEKEFSRKSFVKGGGALIVGFSTLASTAGKASAANANTPFNKRTSADFLPDQTQVDSWITINAGPVRDDQQWLRHSLIRRTPEGTALVYEPVTVTRFPPK